MYQVAMGVGGRELKGVSKLGGHRYLGGVVAESSYPVNKPSVLSCSIHFALHPVRILDGWYVARKTPPK